MARMHCDTDRGVCRTEARVPAPHHAVSPGRTHTVGGALGISPGGRHTAAHGPALLHADSPGCAHVVAAVRVHARVHGGGRGLGAERATPGGYSRIAGARLRSVRISHALRPTGSRYALPSAADWHAVRPNPMPPCPAPPCQGKVKMRCEGNAATRSGAVHAPELLRCVVGWPCKDGDVRWH